MKPLERSTVRIGLVFASPSAGLCSPSRASFWATGSHLRTRSRNLAPPGASLFRTKAETKAPP